jgi:Domain of unknown function (DUF4157)
VSNVATSPVAATAVKLTPTPTRMLQRACACGQHTPAGECEECREHREGTLQRALNLQPKLLVNEPGDVYEQEADRVALQMMGMSDPQPAIAHHLEPEAQRLCKKCEDEWIQRRANGKNEETAPRAPEGIGPTELTTGGASLAGSVRNFYEDRLGYDLSSVRVHTGSDAGRIADGLHARAFTYRDHIWLGPTERPHPSFCLAHELVHVVQQSGAGPPGLSPVRQAMLQRQNDAGLPPGGVPQPETTAPAQQEEWLSDVTEIRTPASRTVRRIVISCTSMLVRLETESTHYTYHLNDCEVPIGSYNTRVVIHENAFELKFGEVLPEGEVFRFEYRVEPGQENPKSMLRDQERVHVDVVDSMSAPAPPPPVPEEPEPPTPQCVIRLDDREVVRPDSTNRQLFEPISHDVEIWSHEIPLGQFGWVQVEANASAHLSGNLSARYGPGRLHDICLTHLVDRSTLSESVPGIYRRTSTDYLIGGKARFTLPARAVIRLIGEGRLRISGDYLSVIEVVAVEGALNALGEATAAFDIDASVEILARASRATTTTTVPPVLPLLPIPIPITITRESLRDINLAAAIALRGRAGLHFRLDAGAGLDLVGFNVWSQSWKLARFNPSVSWAGGLKYSPNPGVKWDLGTFGVGEDVDFGPDEDEATDPSGFHEDTADVDEDNVEDIIEAILKEDSAQVTAPEGRTEDDPLPFTWRKPLDLYPARLDIPNAEDPLVLNRDDGPTTVTYLVRGRSVYEDIGVESENWPYARKKFQYVPHAGRREPEKNRLRRLLTRLGFDRSGTDVDHVHELQFGGDDRFGNLWPADYITNRAAGTRHRDQLTHYRQQLTNINGRWFIIARVEL